MIFRELKNKEGTKFFFNKDGISICYMVIYTYSYLSIVDLDKGNLAEFNYEDEILNEEITEVEISAKVKE